MQFNISAAVKSLIARSASKPSTSSLAQGKDSVLATPTPSKLRSRRPTPYPSPRPSMDTIRPAKKAKSSPTKSTAAARLPTTTPSPSAPAFQSSRDIQYLTREIARIHNLLCQLPTPAARRHHLEYNEEKELSVMYLSNYPELRWTKPAPSEARVERVTRDWERAQRKGKKYEMGERVERRDGEWKGRVVGGCWKELFPTTDGYADLFGPAKGSKAGGVEDVGPHGEVRGETRTKRPKSGGSWADLEDATYQQRMEDARV